MYEVFEQLLQKFGITAADVCKATGIRQSTISNWKSRRNLISGKNAQLIADYFNISVDYLMSGEEKEGGEKYYLNIESSLSREEQRSAFSHAMKHILNCDFQLNDADQIEVNAHDAKGVFYASVH